MRSPRARRQAGVTLLELILVLVVLGVLAGVAVGSISGSERAGDVQRVQNALIGDLRTARMRAMGCGREEGKIHVSIDEGDGWEMADPPCGEPIYGDRDGVTLSSSPSSDVVFTYPWGALQGSSPSAVTIQLSSGDTSQTIRVEPSGAIRCESCGR